MQRSANEVMHDVVYAAVVDAIVALRAASGGLQNTLLRDIGAIHANTTFADLPKELQAAIGASTRGAFTRLLKEGYTVANPALSPDPRSQPPRRDGPPRPPRNAAPANRGPRDPNRPNRGPRSPGGKPSGPRRGPKPS